MNVITIIMQGRRLPLDERYALLLDAKRHFKPNSIDGKHLFMEIERVMFKRIRRNSRSAA